MKLNNFATPLTILLICLSFSACNQESAEENNLVNAREGNLENDYSVSVITDDGLASTLFAPPDALPVAPFVPAHGSWCEFNPLFCGVPFAGPPYDDDEDDEDWFEDLDDYPFYYRTYNGTNNHPLDQGKAAGEEGTARATVESVLKRILPHNYLNDGKTPNDGGLPHPREVSNGIFDQSAPIPNARNMSHFVYFWGQFLDHDITLTPSGDDTSYPIPPFFDPLTMGGINFKRSDILPQTGESNSNPRQHYNAVTSFIDASQVYGSSKTRAEWLRTFEDGKLKTSTNNFLPFGDPSGSSPFMVGLNENPALNGPEDLFVAGDIRANEVVSLTALHTLFVREHNRIAEELKDKRDDLSDEILFQLARKVVGALMQAITYNEFLPALGVKLPDYSNYLPGYDPRISNLFATAAFRIGHTMIADQFVLTDENGVSSTMELFDAFFSPQIINEQIIADLFRGGAANFSEEIDTKMVDGLRNFLFGPPGSGMGLDLAMLNIHRTRDHGLPSYMAVRSLFDGQNHIEQAQQNELLVYYNSIDDVGPWVGFLSEKHLPGSSVGQSIQDILSDQFRKIRDSDKYFYLNDADFSTQGILHHLGYDRAFINKRTLAKIIVDNTSVENSQIDENVFIVP